MGFAVKVNGNVRGEGFESVEDAKKFAEAQKEHGVRFGHDFDIKVYDEAEPEKSL